MGACERVSLLDDDSPFSGRDGDGPGVQLFIDANGEDETETVLLDEGPKHVEEFLLTIPGVFIVFVVRPSVGVLGVPMVIVVKGTSTLAGFLSKRTSCSLHSRRTTISRDAHLG